MTPKRARQELEKRLGAMLLDPMDKRRLEDRLLTEMEELDQRKLWSILGDMKGAPSALKADDILADMKMSVAGYLACCLREEFVPPAPIMGVADLLARVDRLRASKLPDLKDPQIEDLIMAGAFGEPEKAMVEFWHLRDTPQRPIDYARELSLRTHSVRKITEDDLERLLGVQPTPYEDYVSLAADGHTVLLVGQLERLHRTTTKPRPPKQPQDMAMMDLIPLEANEPDARIKVVIWHEGMAMLNAIDPPPIEADLLAVEGKRGFRNGPQIEIGINGKIRALRFA